MDPWSILQSGHSHTLIMSLSKIKDPKRPAEQIASDIEIDWNSAVRTVIISGINAIPYVGSILSTLLRIFWPAPQRDVWGEIKTKVEAVINQHIDRLVYDRVYDNLKGLRLVVGDYVHSAKIGSTAMILSEKWNSTEDHFLHDLPSFQSDGYEVLLLPLFAQFANMHLQLLRDGALHGKEKMGWDDTTAADVSLKLTTKIAEYTEYVNRIYAQGLANARRTPASDNSCEPFRTVNKYEREMTLAVLDFKALWPYLKSTEPVVKYQFFDREIYTDPIGHADDSGGASSMPATPPTKPIKKITVWGWNWIYACEVEYASGGGPDGVTSTGRMGVPEGAIIPDESVNHPPNGGIFDLDDAFMTHGAIVGVAGYSKDVLNSWWFQFGDGSVTNRMGCQQNGPYIGNHFEFKYEDEGLSSIRVMGMSNFYHVADCAVFGFKFMETFPRFRPFIGRLVYASSTCKLTAKDLLARFPGNDHMLEDVEKMIKEENWDKHRSLHWKEP